MAERTPEEMLEELRFLAYPMHATDGSPLHAFNQVRRRLTQLEGNNRRLREALTPFAAIATTLRRLGLMPNGLFTLAARSVTTEPPDIILASLANHHFYMTTADFLRVEEIEKCTD